MAAGGQAPRDGGLDIAVYRLDDAQAKRERLTATDYARVKTVPDYLIAAVEHRYGLPHERAARDVDIWLKEVGPSSRRA